MRLLVAVDQQCGAPVQLIGDIEQMLGELVRRHIRQQRAADAQVNVGAVLVGNERIRRLLDAVVQKLVCALLLDDQPSVDGLPEARVHRLPWIQDQNEGGDLGDIAKTGELFQGLLGRRGQAASASPTMRSTTLSV